MARQKTTVRESLKIGYKAWRAKEILKSCEVINSFQAMAQKIVEKEIWRLVKENPEIEKLIKIQLKKYE